MKDAVVKLGKVLWANHRKKLLAFLLSLLFAGLAAVSGMPLSEVKEAAQEAAKPAVVDPAPPALPQAPVK
jgi:hypothetical protein